MPNGLSQPGGYALGAQAGEAAIRQVTTDAGFTRFRRAAETPFNLVYEVRPVVTEIEAPVVGPNMSDNRPGRPPALAEARSAGPVAEEMSADC